MVAIIVPLILSTPIIVFSVLACNIDEKVINYLNEKTTKKKLDENQNKKKEKNQVEDLLDKFPILGYYRKFDRIRSVPDEVLNGKANINEKNSPVTYTFISISDDKKGVVYKGNLENGDEEMNKNPQKVKKLSLSNLVNKYENVQARIRKKKLDGAKYICEAQNSDLEKERRREHEKRVALDQLENAPCGVIDEVKREIESNGNDLPKKIPGSLKNEENTEKITDQEIKSRCLSILNVLDGENFTIDVSDSVTSKFNGYDVKKLLKNVESENRSFIIDLITLMEKAPYNTIVRSTEIAESKTEFLGVLKDKVEVLEGHYDYKN